MSQPQFGEKCTHQPAVRRPGAYAVIVDAQQRILVVQAGRGYFLPGGGIDPGETPEEALHREVAEECGYTITIVHEIGEAVEYLYARDEETYYQIHAVFFAAVLGESITLHSEDDHILVWLDAATALARLHRQSQVWAVQQVLGRS